MLEFELVTKSNLEYAVLVALAAFLVALGNADVVASVKHKVLVLV